MSNLIQDQDIKSDDEEDVKWLALSLYTGGAETTVAAIRGFFKAMLLFPDVQRRAQAELDSVIGNDRLPTFTDRGSLPYINAVVLEVIRWFAVIPTGCVATSHFSFIILTDGYMTFRPASCSYKG